MPLEFNGTSFVAYFVGLLSSSKNLYDQKLFHARNTVRNLHSAILQKCVDFRYWEKTLGIISDI